MGPSVWPLVRHCAASNKRWRMERENLSCALSVSKLPAVGLRTAGTADVGCGWFARQRANIGRGKWTVEGKGKAEIFPPPWGRFALSPNGSCIKMPVGTAGLEFGVCGVSKANSPGCVTFSTTQLTTFDFRNITQTHEEGKAAGSFTGTLDH